MNNTENKEQETIENKEKEKTIIKQQENQEQEKTANETIQKKKNGTNSESFSVIITALAICWVLSIIGGFLYLKQYLYIIDNSFICTIPGNFIKGGFNIFKQNIYICLLVICFIGIVYNFSEKSKKFIKYSLMFIGIILFSILLIYAIASFIYTHVVGLGLLFNVF